jgi:hypothetical protein
MAGVGLVQGQTGLGFVVVMLTSEIDLAHSDRSGFGSNF